MLSVDQSQINTSDVDAEIEVTANDSNGEVKNMRVEVEGKKDPSLRRYVLVESQLAEVAVGGTGGVLESLSDRLDALHKAVASRAALEKTNEPEEEKHVPENFHSSRMIRKLVPDSANFATTLWKTALKGKCEIWAQGHSRMIVAAYLESSNFKVRKMANVKLQPLVERGILKAPEKAAMEVEA